jgi:hypothetical protein
VYTECKLSTHCSWKTLARSQIMTGRFLRSLYVGRITEYLWVSGVANWPCMSRDTLLSKGFIIGIWKLFQHMMAFVTCQRECHIAVTHGIFTATITLIFTSTPSSESSPPSNTPHNDYRRSRLHRLLRRHRSAPQHSPHQHGRVPYRPGRES